MDEQTDTEYLTLESILEMPDIEEEDLAIPEWGGQKVRLKTLTKEEQFYIRDHAIENAKREKFGAPLSEIPETTLAKHVEQMMLSVAIVKPKVPEDRLPDFMKKRAAAVQRILNRINAMSGMTEVAQTSAEAVKEAVKSSS